jgi:ankyrin repeat protein
VLLRWGANVDLRNAQGATALHDAALAGKLDVVQLLVEKGANVNAKDNESGATPLHHAASWGRTEVVTFLLENGADASIRTKGGDTALESAVVAGQKEVAELLRRAPRPSPLHPHSDRRKP